MLVAKCNTKRGFFRRRRRRRRWRRRWRRRKPKKREVEGGCNIEGEKDLGERQLVTTTALRRTEDAI